MKGKVFDVELSIEKDNDNLIAHLSFTNNSESDLFLDQQTICLAGKLQNNLFSIFNEKKKTIDYTGIMVSRDVEADDFIALMPGQNVKSSVMLNTNYKLKIGHKYRIQYDAFNPHHSDKQKLIRMQSNQIEVSY